MQEKRNIKQTIILLILISVLTGLVAFAYQISMDLHQQLQQISPATSNLNSALTFYTYSGLSLATPMLLLGIGIALPAMCLAFIYGWLQLIFLTNGFVLPEILSQGFIETLLQLLKSKPWHAG